MKTATNSFPFHRRPYSEIHKLYTLGIRIIFSSAHRLCFFHTLSRETQARFAVSNAYESRHPAIQYLGTQMRFDYHTSRGNVFCCASEYYAYGSFEWKRPLLQCDGIFLKTFVRRCLFSSWYFWNIPRLCGPGRMPEWSDPRQGLRRESSVSRQTALVTTPVAATKCHCRHIEKVNPWITHWGRV